MSFDLTTRETVFDAQAARGSRVPWWVKIGAKMVLSRVLPSYAWRRRLGIGVHSYWAATIGHRDEIRRAIALHTALTGRGPEAMLELGPGDSLANALYAAAEGVRTIWLVDAGDFATADMAVYERIVRLIEADCPDFAARVDLSSRAAMLASLGARYLTGGTGDLGRIPAGSIDLIVSYMVLEHVGRGTFDRLLAETRRILAPDGLAYHFVDLMDHLGGRLNNLRFPDALWEHPAMAGSGFYTNRLRCTEILARAREAGLEASVPFLSRWPVLPTPRGALHRQFAGFSDAELRIAYFGLLLRRPLSDRTVSGLAVSEPAC
ncbi:class I SAM-dependent methyltransferase [Limobrevibacterium gyesilva]|uniref:Class I SAM-dependent methyltransferase n=1 Tax=Limobrevibacterium gyesilva TaxID=2991712 RepID=A0AA41YL15_9PROT|nr:class I SAM-dependent methyltransferase [Limobrevibacterium gyesilva]MCW3475359.1 class I SAM-dependent methyltransferase [Limobrevibacterium gyesilva]